MSAPTITPELTAKLRELCSFTISHDYPAIYCVLYENNIRITLKLLMGLLSRAYASVDYQPNMLKKYLHIIDGADEINICVADFSAEIYEYNIARLTTNNSAELTNYTHTQTNINEFYMNYFNRGEFNDEIYLWLVAHDIIFDRGIIDIYAYKKFTLNSYIFYTNEFKNLYVDDPNIFDNFLEFKTIIFIKFIFNIDSIMMNINDYIIDVVREKYYIYLTEYSRDINKLNDKYIFKYRSDVFSQLQYFYENFETLNELKPLQLIFTDNFREYCAREYHNILNDELQRIYLNLYTLICEYRVKNLAHNIWEKYLEFDPVAARFLAEYTAGLIATDPTDELVAAMDTL